MTSSAIANVLPDDDNAGAPAGAGVVVAVGVGATPPHSGWLEHGAVATVADDESQAIRHVTSHASCSLAGAVVASPQHSLPQTQQTSIRQGGAAGQSSS